jgi:hypothetical protein
MSLSDRKKRSIRQKKKDAIETVEETIEAIRKKQQSGKTLNTKELDSLKWGIKYIEDTEHEIVEKVQDVIPEGKLKTYVDNLERIQNRMIECTGNRRYKLDKEQFNGVADEMGYFRCELCGELHVKGRECMFNEYINNKTKK